jgi:hypothetical protein
MPKMNENNVFPDKLIRASLIDLATMTSPSEASCYVSRQIPMHSLFLHLTDFFALLVFAVDGDPAS